MICRVQAKYDGKVMGEAYLGSCVAESGEVWSAHEADQLEGLRDQAVDEARNEAVRMLEILKADFLN
jgi:hypothetical protein